MKVRFSYNFFRVAAVSFDTTSSNTGKHNGACSLLQTKIGKPLLNLACRHHIDELFLTAVFETLGVDASTGPDVTLFKLFREKWNTLDKSNYVNGYESEFVRKRIPLKERKRVLNFIEEQLTQYHPRNDYYELLNLCATFLGRDSKITYKVIAPGALHRARWMAKILYILKIFLYRKQLNVEKKEVQKLERFLVFVVTIYIEHWFKCQSPSRAPRNDLNLLKSLINYKKTDKIVAEAALLSFSRHLWYISETLIGLCLFDDGVSDNVKNKIAAKMISLSMLKTHV